MTDKTDKDSIKSLLRELVEQQTMAARELKSLRKLIEDTPVPEAEYAAVADNTNTTSEPTDEQYDLVKAYVAHTRTVSMYTLQRRLGLTFSDIRSMVKRLEKEGHIGPAQKDATPREIFIDKSTIPLPTINVKDGGFFFANPDTQTDVDELYETAKQIVLTTGQASTSFLQRKLQIGYSRAAQLIDLLEENGVIGPQDGPGPRDIFNDDV